MIILLLFSIVVLLVLKYILDTEICKSKLKHFRCPPQTFLLGHLRELSKDTLGIVTEYNKIYGKLLHLNATYFAPVLLVSDRDIIKEITTSPKAITKGRIYDAFHKTAPGSLPLATGERWQGARKLLNPAFTIQSLERSIKIFNSGAAILADKLGNHGDKAFEVTPLLELCTLDATFESLMGTKINSQLDESHKLNVSTRKMHDIFEKKILSPWSLVKAMYIFTPTYWKETATVNAISKETKKVIRKRREVLQKGCNNETIPFLDTMLTGDISGRKLTDQDIINELNAFIFASRDTVGSTVASAVHILSHYPKIQSRVAEELKEIFEDDITRPVTIEDLKQMKYLEAVLKETMRMYPPLPFIARKLKEDQTFNGVLIPANINVILCIHAMQNNEDYFPNPNDFNPERFEGDNVSSIKPFSYIPFSAGFRNCIGQRYAMYQLKIIMAHILRRHELLPVGEEKLHMIVKVAVADSYKVKGKTQIYLVMLQVCNIKTHIFYIQTKPYISIVNQVLLFKFSLH